jgi:diguanylate cyclase (GGDEF)-like protein
MRLSAGKILLIALLSGMGFVAFKGATLFPRPVVRVAYNQFPPYVDKGPDGIPVGFAAEIFAQAASNAKVDVRWVEIKGSANDAFATGKADMYPLMTITAEREKLFHMSPPWWENQFALISTAGREIPDAAATRGKRIASRIGLIKNLSQRLFPDANFVDMLTLPEMESALCSGQIDGFFSDARLLQAQLMQRTRGCAGQALHAISVPGSRLMLGTASTKAAATVNDRIFREIAKLALDGTLTRAASNWGIFTPYDTARLRQTVDAETRETRMGWMLLTALVILTFSVIQTNLLHKAKRAAESAQAEAKEMHERFNEFMKHTPTITFMKDGKGGVVYSNEEYCVVGPAGTISRKLTLRDEEVLEQGRRIEVTETIRGEDGKSRHFLVLKFPFRGAAGARFLGGVALDVTARIQAEKELEFHAKSDLLTGLPNRRNFMLELGKALQREQQLAVSFVDLDGFKRVNDVMGHEAGDELLRQVAIRLKAACGESDMVARLGGDEFTFFLPKVSAVDARQTMSRVLSELHESFSIGGKEIIISASIGVSLYPDHGTNSQQLLRKADSAMYWAKQHGKGCVEFWQHPTAPLPTWEAIVPATPVHHG